MVGQWLGARAPERIGRLVLANTSAFMGPPAGWQQRIDTVLREGMGAVAEAVLERWFTPEFRASSHETVAAVRDMLLTTSPRGYAGCCAAIRDMDLRVTAPRIEAATLIIAGARDLSTPPGEAEALARAMGSRPRVATLDAAHLSNVERAGAFNRAVLDFLAA
jgi:3-oxoadipate enol-lactonase